MSKTVFIKNNRPYATTLVAVKIGKGKDDTGREIETRETLLETLFPVFVKSPDTGSIMHTGFTPITEEEYTTFIKHSPMFKDYIRTGDFEKFDEAPEAALLDSQLIERLNMTILEQAQRIADLEAGLTGEKEIALQERVAELEAIIAGLKAGVKPEEQATPVEGDKGLF